MIEMKQIWNNICVISLKTDTKETKIYIYSEINYFFQLSFFSNLNATSYSIHNRIISFRISYVNKTPLRRIPANICWSSRRVEDVFKTYLEHVFTRLQRNKFSSSSWRHLGRRKIVTLNTSSSRLEDIFKTSWRQTKCLLGISVCNKSKCVSSESIFHKSISDESKANPKCNN